MLPVRPFFLSVLLCALALAPAAAAQRVVYNLTGEPKTLDPHLATGVLESNVIAAMIEGLTLSDEKGMETPGIAERWEVSSDGTSYTFHLRDAKWNTGDPVTAADFVYGWRRCLNPATASEYAYQLYPVAGAEDYNKGKSTDPATVGISAPDPRTVVVRLSHPTPYFLSLLSHYSFSPLSEKWVSAHPDWATNPAHYPSNGPFSLAEWRPRDRIIVKKNPQYYNAAQTRLDEIEMPMIVNESTALMQWETGKIDIVETAIPLPDVPRLNKAGDLQKVPYAGTYYVALQHEKKPFDDPRVRRAFALAVNRRQITDAILRGGQPAATGIVPPGMPIEGGKDYREVAGPLFQENIAEAKKLLAEAGYPNGRGLPRIRYMYNDLQMHRTIGEALQRMWLQNLGAKVDLQVQEYKVYIQNLHAENFQMARAGWIADYLDPVAFLDMFQTGAGNNDFKYSNPKFDKLVSDSRATTDPTARLGILRQAEEVLIKQDMTVIPLYFYVRQYLQKPKVKGTVRNATGSLYFHKAYVEE